MAGVSVVPNYYLFEKKPLCHFSSLSITCVALSYSDDGLTCIKFSRESVW